MANNVSGGVLMARFPPQIEYKYDGKVYRVAGPTAKFVAVIMADSCNPDGKSACRGISSICDMTGYTRPTVISALRGLAALGVIKHRGVNSFYRTNSYDVNVQKLVEMAEGTHGAELQESSGFTDSKADGKADSKMDGKATLLKELTITLNPEEEEEQTPRKNIFQLYENTFGSIPPALIRDLEVAEEKYQAEWITEALKISAENGAKGWAYTRKILEDWSANGFKNGAKKDKRNVPPPARTQPAATRIEIPKDWLDG
jgi:DnaD/phage-associated family protein